MPLKPQQQRFVEEYLIDLNAAQAAIRAGYSERGAKVQGSRLLKNPEIMAAIAEAKQQRSEATGIDAEWVLKKSVALHEAALQEKAFAPAARALELVGKHIDVQAFREKVEHAGPNGGAIPIRFDLSGLTDEELEQLERIRSRIAIPGGDQGGEGAESR